MYNRIWQDLRKSGIMKEDIIKKEKKDKKKEKYLGYRFTKKGSQLNPPNGGSNVKKIGCPICGDTENLIPSGRCVTCLSCGWSKCSL